MVELPDKSLQHPRRAVNCGAIEVKKALRDQLASIRTRMGQRAAELSATPEQDEAKEKFGRIFQADHTSLRLAQRDLDEIDREAARPRLLEIVGDRAVLYFRQTNIFVPIIRLKTRTTRADDWLAITAYRVNSEQEARRKAARDNSPLIVLKGSTSDVE